MLRTSPVHCSIAVLQLPFRINPSYLLWVPFWTMGISTKFLGMRNIGNVRILIVAVHKAIYEQTIGVPVTVPDPVHVTHRPNSHHLFGPQKVPSRAG